MLSKSIDAVGSHPSHLWNAQLSAQNSEDIRGMTGGGRGPSHAQTQQAAASGYAST
ncbi:hypothetical protein GGE59_001086 [Rhizobium leguminosarum]|nr:hypothetical protein [Rhizobium esperanzae]MBB4540525.1 hypothetical protein [Rhizobium leguminosarum]MBB5678148.1 hypothetical protein [Rhizobium leguminosarum]